MTGRRSDGYHLLDSLVVFAGVADTVSVTPARGLSLSLAGPEVATLAEEADNLVLRAARMLAEAGGVPANAALGLVKHLPVASGIGGGSADAAATLRALNVVWGLGFTPSRLAGLALGLGADVPACVASRPCRMGGVGERLSTAPSIPAFGLLLANPRVALATPAVFRARHGAYSSTADLGEGWTDAAAMARDLAKLGNDLEIPAIRLCPAVGEVLQCLRALPSCLMARMSGSGATCFGIFPDAAAAAGAAGLLPEAWWRWGGGLHETGG